MREGHTERDRERETRISSTCYFTLQMATIQKWRIIMRKKSNLIFYHPVMCNTKKMKKKILTRISAHTSPKHQTTSKKYYVRQWFWDRRIPSQTDVIIWLGGRH